jgi:hypothetical protein
MLSLLLPRGSVLAFIAAQPQDLESLRLQNEQGELERSVGHHFRISTQFAARPEDLVTTLANHKPHVLHFAGHGAGADGLAMENRHGKMTLLHTKTLEKVLAEKSLSSNLRLVVLNACWSSEQARVIAEQVPAVISMRSSILDATAMKFTSHFYAKLAEGKTISDAFHQTLLILDIKKTPDRHVPELQENARLIALLVTLNLPAWNRYFTENFSIEDLQTFTAVHFEEFHRLEWKPNASLSQQTIHFLDYIRKRKKVGELREALRQTRGAEFTDLEHTLCS